VDALALTLPQLVINGLLLGAVYALAAAGLNLIFGVMRIVNFAHGDLMILGAYTAFGLYTAFQLNPLMSLPVTIVLLFLLGWTLQGGLLGAEVGSSPFGTVWRWFWRIWTIVLWCAVALLVLAFVILQVLAPMVGFHPPEILVSDMGVAFAAAVCGLALGDVLRRGLVDRIVGQPPLMSLLLLWGVSLVIINVGLYLWTSNARSIPVFSGPVQIGGLTVSQARGIAFTAAIAMCVAVWLFLQYTRWGMAIRATAQSAEMALVCGIDVRRVRQVTFGLAAAMAGAAGNLIVFIFAVSPGVGPSYLLKAFAIIVIGGLGSFPGALFGALVVGVIESLSAYALTSQASDAVVYFALIAFLLVRPSGLMGARA
jgi:branched-chain amino acid transport system permease protein